MPKSKPIQKPPLKAGRLQSRPDYYVRAWRVRAHRESSKSKLWALRLHRSYLPEIRRIAKSNLRTPAKAKLYLEIAEHFNNEYERGLRARIDPLREQSRNTAYDIVNKMLPKGVSPPSPKVTGGEYWDHEWKGATPNERLARLRVKTKRAMQTASTRHIVSAGPPVVGMDEEAGALRAWGNVESYAALLASEETYGAQTLEYARGFNEQVDVIDHYEHLATLDALTCEECASLDGQELQTGGGEIDEWDLLDFVDIHPNCRCTAVPVTKSWEELGFEPTQEPEGTRISRPYYPETEIITTPGGETKTRTRHDWGPSAPTGYITPSGEIVDTWKPGYQAIGGVEEYVPANIRYADWLKNKGKP